VSLLVQLRDRCVALLDPSFPLLRLFAGDLNFWRGEAYTKFFDHLDKAGGFYYERWVSSGRVDCSDRKLTNGLSAIGRCPGSLHWSSSVCTERVCILFRRLNLATNVSSVLSAKFTGSATLDIDMSHSRFVGSHSVCTRNLIPHNFLAMSPGRSTHPGQMLV
jgi:hypothetical protein